MSLEQEDIDRLYDVAVIKANEILGNDYNRWNSRNSKQHFKEALYFKMRNHFVVQPGNLRWKRNGYFIHPGQGNTELGPLAELFKRKRLSFFRTELSKETIMLHKVMDKVTNEHFSEEDKCWFDLDSAIDSMDAAVDEMKKINKEGEQIGNDLAKIPEFLESGKWE